MRQPPRYYSRYGSSIPSTVSQSHYSRLRRSLWSRGSAQSLKISSERGEEKRGIQLHTNGRSGMCTWAYKETRRHMVAHNSVTAPRWILRGQINSSTPTALGKQITFFNLLSGCRTQWSPRLQLELQSSILYFSIFYFSYFLSISLSLSLSLCLPPTFSFRSLPLSLAHLSFLLLFMLSEFHRWSD